eukprot:GEZU01013555.1.p1 GENE.GEZU01013555.1~~GEZU01013555.1.p1  ORF type:complete len:481 (+),score=119.18 GEZU01013555.1:241-1683(+)
MLSSSKKFAGSGLTAAARSFLKPYPSTNGGGAFASAATALHKSTKKLFASAAARADNENSSSKVATTQPFKEHALNSIIEGDDPKVKLAVVDIDGILRGKYINRDKFFSLAKDDGRLGFCSVVFGWDMHDQTYDQCKFSGYHNGYPDAPVRIDFSTFRRVPWDNNVAFFLVDVEDCEKDGAGAYVCPRSLLKKIIARARDKLQIEAKFACEFEFFNFQETSESIRDKFFVHKNFKTLTPGNFGYSILRSGNEYMTALMDELTKFGIPIEGIHTETGPGVYECAIQYADTLEAADRAALFKTSVKEIASRFGIMPTFMAKWNKDLPGSSGHIHQSLYNTVGTEQKNIFYDANDKHKMSNVFKSYLAGQIQCLPEIMPMFAPTVNSYKRVSAVAVAVAVAQPIHYLLSLTMPQEDDNNDDDDDGNGWMYDPNQTHSSLKDIGLPPRPPGAWRTARYASVSSPARQSPLASRRASPAPTATPT